MHGVHVDDDGSSGSSGLGRVGVAASSPRDAIKGVMLGWEGTHRSQA